MSAQTGVSSASGPASKRFVDRARYRAERLKNEPNPIWIRELKQAARLTRTPVVLSVVTILVTLLMASIGGIMTTSLPPATTGVAIFHVFFSLAYFVVTLVGPALAANSIASEREGRTWEAVILTGLRPGQIARGKFLAAYTSIAMYIVMLAPVGALPFLFGGITTLEVIVAFVLLFLFSLLSVAFGLAISSKMSSLRTAILVTLLLAFPISLLAYFLLGVALSYAAAHAWPGITGGGPVWMPMAYERAPFDLSYVVFLIALPIALVAIPAWFLYEVTIANLTSVTDDRSTGLKRWFFSATPTMTVCAAVPMLAGGDHVPLFLAGMGGLFLFLMYGVFLFQGDPVGPSRRVLVHWHRANAGRLRRFLGPGVMRSAALLLLAGLGCMALLTAAGLVIIEFWGTGSSTKMVQIATFAGYCAAFYLFLVGFGAWSRARSKSSITARVFTFSAFFGAGLGPWIVAAIGGVVADPGSAGEALIIAAPSPFYAFLMVDALDRPDRGSLVAAGVACALFWALTGLALLAIARSKCATIIREHETALADADRRLAEEDAQAAAAATQEPGIEEPAPTTEPSAQPS